MSWTDKSVDVGGCDGAAALLENSQPPQSLSHAPTPTTRSNVCGVVSATSSPSGALWLLYVGLS